MPLIRALRGWMGRRMAVTETSYPVGRLDHAGWGSEATGLTWLVLWLIGLPVIAAILLIGLAYEIVIRVDGARLPEFLRWTIASGLGLTVVAAVTVAVIDRF